MSLEPSSKNSPDPSNQSLGSVMLVEDNMRVSEELSLVLESFGYTTKCAYDGQHMRSLLTTYTPDIVILDLNLPNEDGIS